MADKEPQEPADLECLRKKIDDLDKQIVDLLNQRAAVVVEVGKAKKAGGTPVYSPDREHLVLKRIAELNKGPLSQATLLAIYRELMSGSFLLERPQRVGYLGPEGSYSHVAAVRKFGASVEYRALADIRAVFEEVARKHCDLGLVPVENSAGGAVIDTLDCFIEMHVYICAEVLTEVHHNLLATCPPEEIRTIASKPEVFAQCRKWLSTSFQKVELLPVASSSRAAQMAAETPGMAAIGSVLAAEIYGLRVVFANIEDVSNNVTRFLVISPESAKRTGEDRTSMMFTTSHKSGALVEVLNVFARHGLNLTNIDTRPSKRRNWEYYFFVDAEGHAEDENFRKALAEAEQHCGELHVLGSFPRATGPM
jgi:chorismate mutase/prephenate dehydratase